MASAKKLNMKNVVASPVLVGSNNTYVWTGVVKSENIKNLEYLIPDSKKRVRFQRLVQEFENCVLEYRNSDKIANSPLISFTQTVRSEIDKPTLEAKIRNLSEDIKDILNSSDSGIDMGLFWVQLCREYEEIYANNPNEFKAMSSDARKNLRIFVESMNENEPLLREFYDDEKNKYKTYQFFTLEQEKKYAKKGKNGIDELIKAISVIEGRTDLSNQEFISVIKEISERITLVDLQVILQNKRYAEMEYISVFKNYLLSKGNTSKDIERLTVDELREKAQQFFKEEKMDMHAQLIAGCIIDGARYVDVEKLMLLYMSRSFELFDAMAPEKGEVASYGKKSLDNLAEKARESVDNEKYEYKGNSVEDAMEKMRRTEHICQKVIEAGIVSKKSSATVIYGDNTEYHSYRDVEKSMKKFCDGIYLTYTTQLNLLYNAYENPNEISSWSDELVKRVEFTENDLFALSLINFENFKRFYSLGKMKKEDIERFLIEAESGNFDKSIEEAYEEEPEEKERVYRNKELLLKNLYFDGYLNEKEIEQFFEHAIVTKDMLDNIEEGMSEAEKVELYGRFKNVFNKEMLLPKYKAYAEKYAEFIKYQNSHPENEKEIEKLRDEVNFLRKEKERYREVFEKYNQIPEEEKINFGDELLENYYIEMDVSDENVLKESLKVLYEDGLIGLENIIHMDSNYIIPMLDKLSLEDANKVRKSMSFKDLEHMLDTIFADSEFTDERKFIVVMNLFGEDSEEDKTAREFYLSLLEFNDGERKSKRKGPVKPRNKGTGKEFNKYVYPDFVKWKFYKALDKDVRATRYVNGFVEFASSKLGVRIIEKYYDGDKPAYGTATYILPEEEFRRNEAELVTIGLNGNCIMESATLREIVPQKDRIAHRTQSINKTWMDEMLKYFDIDSEREKDSRYSEEEMKKLQSVVKDYKTFYEMIM